MPTGRLILVLYIYQTCYVGTYSAPNDVTPEDYVTPVFNQSEFVDKNEAFIPIKPVDYTEKTNEGAQTTAEEDSGSMMNEEGTTEVANMKVQTTAASTTLSPDELKAQAESIKYWLNFHHGTLAVSVPTNKLNEPEYQWHVTIYYRDGENYEQLCGGSLVTRDVVISAAHCFWDDLGVLPADRFAVGSAKKQRKWSQFRINKSNITEIIVPPRFLGVKTNFQEDIAILKLETPFRYEFGAKPLCVDFDVDLDRKQLTTGNNGTILGFGLTEENGEPSEVLNFQRLPYVDIASCINASDPDFLKYLTSDKICAGDQVTGRALCKGDSGGGLVFFSGNINSSVPYLRGIASAAPRSKNKCNAFAIGSFTHLRKHKTFLTDNIPGLEKECSIVYQKELAEIAKSASQGMTADSSLLQGIERPGAATVDTILNEGGAGSSLILASPVDDEDSSPDDDSSVDSEDDGNTDPNYLRTVPKVVPRIMNSSAPAIEWHVTVYRKTRRPYEQICGGTLVKTDFFISAAHCFFNDTKLVSAKQFAVAGGKVRRPWGEPSDEYAQYSDVKRIWVPKTFKEINTKLRSCYQHDIAVGFLATPFTYAPGVRPACVDFTPELDRQHLQPGSLGVFTGYGHTRHKCEPYPHLFYRQLPYVDLGCYADPKSFPYGENIDVCAGVVALLGSDTLPSFVKVQPPCPTDSGGGLIYLEGSSSDIVPYLRGVATTSPGHNECNLYIVDSFIRLRDEQGFLEAVIPELEEECNIAYPVADNIDEIEPNAEDAGNVDEAQKGVSKKPNVSPNDQLSFTGMRPDLSELTNVKHPEQNGPPERVNGPVVTTTTTETPKKPVSNASDGKLHGIPFTANPSLDFTSKINNPDKVPFEKPGSSNRATMKPMFETNPIISTFVSERNDTEKPIEVNKNVPEHVTSAEVTSVVPQINPNATEKPVDLPSNMNTKFPWHVAIYDKFWTPYMHLCGGSLVKRDVVLSAGHCFWSDFDFSFGAQAPSKFTVGAGKFYRAWNDSRDRDAQYSHVKDIIYPDRFMGMRTSLQDDIAIVRLETPFEYGAYVKPVCVEFGMETELMRMGKGTLAGWGLREDETYTNLKHVELSYVEAKECVRNEDKKSVKYITSDKFCAGGRKDTYLCKTDIGGGLVYIGAHPTLAGISSRPPMGLCNPTTHFKFTQITSHISFLRENVRDIERECFNVYGAPPSPVYSPVLQSLPEMVRNGFNGFSNAHLNLVCNCNCDG